VKVLQLTRIYGRTSHVLVLT